MLKRKDLKPGKTYKAVNAKTGAEIVGRLEIVPGTALASEFTVSANGKALEPEFEGETNLDWDLQKPEMLKRGKRELYQYLDANAETVLESEMHFVEVE